MLSLGGLEHGNRFADMVLPSTISFSGGAAAFLVLHLGSFGFGYVDGTAEVGRAGREGLNGDAQRASVETRRAVACGQLTGLFAFRAIRG